MHIDANLQSYAQLFVGTPLELEQGHLRTLLVYLTSIIAGAIASSHFQPTQTLLGASAGGFGMLTSHLPHTILVIYFLFQLPKSCFIKFHLNCNRMQKHFRTDVTV